MPKNPSDFVVFSEIKKAVSILQILDRYDLTGSLHRSGDNLMGVCPIHKGQNRTQFRVSLAKNCWNCFGACKEGGNILDFVSRMENVNIREAALLIQKWFLAPDPVEPQKKPAKEKQQAPAQAPAKEEAPEEPPEAAVNTPLTFSLNKLDHEHPYLAERGLEPETIREFGLGYCGRGVMTGRIAIPIHNENGELVAYAGRWPGDPPADTPKYKLPPGFHKGLVIFNLHRAKLAAAEHGLVLVEGFFDCLKLWQAGVHQVIALMGSSLSPAQEKLIVETLGPTGKAILMFDEDPAGQVCRDQVLARLASQVYVKIVPLGEEGRQPDRMDIEEIQALLC